MHRVRRLIERVGPRETTVLIRGESGTGKELVARAIHVAGPRQSQTFVPVDCTTLRDTLFESQMFGHARGAFTGAHRETLGFIRAADGGTLFLDEVGELDPVNQARLLRYLQESTVTAVGTVKPVAVDVRVVAATHRDLDAMVRAGTFRQDLFFRLNVVQLDTPPLRERPGDIPELVAHYLQRLSALYDEPPRRLADEAMRALCRAPWPGNVRELINAVEHMYVMSPDDEIGIDRLPEKLRQYDRVDPSVAASPETLAPTQDQGKPANGDTAFGVMPLEYAQQRLVEKALAQTEGHQGRAAALLQVERRRFYRLVRRYELSHLTQRR